MKKVAKEQQTQVEFPCRICGKAAVVDVTNFCLDAESGSYCSTHAPRLVPPNHLEATA
jgi:hypothetical protein